MSVTKTVINTSPLINPPDGYVLVWDGNTNTWVAGQAADPSQEISLFAGVQTASSSTLVRCASRRINLDYFPATFNGKTLTITLQTILEVNSSAVTASLSLIDITTEIPVSVITLTSNSELSEVVTSSPLTVGVDLFSLNTYELDLQLSAGSGIATCSGAWLSITYV